MKSEEIKKKYWTIGEVARMLGITASAIRFYEVYFDLNVIRNKQGLRKFTVIDKEDISVLFKLIKVDGYTLKAAKREFLEYKSSSSDNDEKKK